MCDWVEYEGDGCDCAVRFLLSCEEFPLAYGIGVYSRLSDLAVRTTDPYSMEWNQHFIEGLNDVLTGAIRRNVPLVLAYFAECADPDLRHLFTFHVIPLAPASDIVGTPVNDGIACDAQELVWEREHGLEREPLSVLRVSHGIHDCLIR